MPLQFIIGRGLVWVPPPAEKKASPGPPRPQAGQAAADFPVVPVGWVLLRADGDSTLAVLAELGERAPRPVGGYGGWQSVPRSLEEALTSWSGFDPYAIEMDLVLDNLIAGRSIEDVYDTLE